MNRPTLAKAQGQPRLIYGLAQLPLLNETPHVTLRWQGPLRW